MDYVVGSIAALISGNVTPSRPKQLKKAHTPIKHQPSPNVTPKSEFVDDRSIFLSPTMQKKKAIVKKSPKRIFQSPDLDITNNEEDSTIKSPKADKVKKHLKGELDAGSKVSQIELNSNSPEVDHNEVKMSPKKKSKKKRHNDSVVQNIEIQNTESEELVLEGKNFNADKENISNTENANISKKKKKRLKSLNRIETGEGESNAFEEIENIRRVSKKRKNNELAQNEIAIELNDAVEAEDQSPKKKNKKKKKSKLNKNNDIKLTANEDLDININAVTNKDTDSEHDSDNEIGSENEEIYNTTIDSGPMEGDKSSDDEAPQEPKIKSKDHTKGPEKCTEDEIIRTVFVGNVPFSSKCKKEIKKIFDKYGQIETVRIRSVPVKDARHTPKLAVIKNVIHPNRTTVNVYVKFTNAESVEKALAANNTVLHDNHLRVSRSETSGDTHDPKCSVFVGNIPFALEDDALWATFARCGRIDSVRIVRDKKTNAGKGFGYVNFASKDGVELALALTEEDLTIKNRIMRVKRCTQTAPNRLAKKDFKKQGHQGNKMGHFGNNFGGNQNKNEGAYRRLMLKRKNQESGDGPPNKRKNLYQPNKGKKERKEFVGMTAEKKKKSKFDKGHKKKKQLSEILTKK